MYLLDRLSFASRSITRQRLRTLLLLLALAIGVAAVVLLSALGEGARRYVTGEFSALGSNLLIMLPGRNETRGGAPPVFGETPRDLTLEDALALYRSHHVLRLAPLSVGSTLVSYSGRSRETTVLGTTSDFKPIRHIKLAQGQFLPLLPADQAAPLCVLGGVVRDELFKGESALGRWVRIADRRCRVIGILENKGVSLGTDLSEVVILPVASAQQILNTQSLFRILIEVRQLDALQAAQDSISSIIRTRHEGEDDVTILTQAALLGTFERIFGALTLALVGIAAISLLVAGILIMNVTLVAVTQRTSEIGLLKALGASSRTVQQLFLSEALLQALAGALLGLLLSGLGIAVARRVFPSFPLAPPWWAPVLAVGVAIGAALLFAWLPARRAAGLDPVRALGR